MHVLVATGQSAPLNPVWEDQRATPASLRFTQSARTASQSGKKNEKDEIKHPFSSSILVPR